MLNIITRPDLLINDGSDIRLVLHHHYDEATVQHCLLLIVVDFVDVFQKPEQQQPSDPTEQLALEMDGLDTCLCRL